MSVVSFTQPVNNIKQKVILWGPLGNGDTGDPYLLPSHFLDKTVQVYGTFGSGGSVDIEGTCDPTVGTTHWEVTINTANLANTIGAHTMATVLENVYQIRPHVTAGDGTTALYVLLLLRNVD